MNANIDNGLYISFSGIITFKNVDDIINILKFVPLDRILVETDSPYLAPVPFRGKPNEPSYIIHTIEKLSQIKNITKQEVMKNTTNNFKKLFNLD